MNQKGGFLSIVLALFVKGGITDNLLQVPLTQPDELTFWTIIISATCWFMAGVLGWLGNRLVSRLFNRKKETR